MWAEIYLLFYFRNYFAMQDLNADNVDIIFTAASTITSTEYCVDDICLTIIHIPKMNESMDHASAFCYPICPNTQCMTGTVKSFLVLRDCSFNFSDSQLQKKTNLWRKKKSLLNLAYT